MSWFHIGGENDPVPPHAGPKGTDRGRRIGIVVRYTLYRNRIRGLEKIPSTGPVLVVSNHTNFMDGAVLFGSLPRRVSFLIKAEAVKGPLGWLLTNVGQYSLHRDVPDREPLMQALAQLKAGGAIGIFPEGTRGAGTVQNVFNGAGWLAARAGATVVPVAIRGTSRPEGRRRRRFRPVVDMLVGEPFEVPVGAGKTAVNAATELIRENLAALVAVLDAELHDAAGHQGAPSSSAPSKPEQSSTAVPATAEPTRTQLSTTPADAPLPDAVPADGKEQQ